MISRLTAHKVGSEVSSSTTRLPRDFFIPDPAPVYHSRVIACVPQCHLLDVFQVS